MTVQVLTTRSCFIGGQPFDAGVVVDVPPADALNLVGSTRGRLVDAADQAVLQKHVDAVNVQHAQSSKGTWRPSHF